MTGMWNTEFFNTWWAFVGVLICFISIIALLFILLEQDKKITLQEELRETRHAMELEQSHYKEVDKRRAELSKIRHDFNNQLAAIGNLIQLGDEDTAQEMIKSLSSEIIKTKENPYCHIPVINAILLDKNQVCEEHCIALEVDLDLPQTLEVQPLHLCSVFSNLLDNAINASKNTKFKNTPLIRLNSTVDGDYLFIKVANPSNKPPKTPAPGRGYGSRILSDIAARYSGDYRVEYKGGVYTAIVALCCPNPG